MLISECCNFFSLYVRTCSPALLLVIYSYSSYSQLLLSCTTIHRYPAFRTRYSVSEIEHGLCACTIDNPLAKARGLSLRTGAQTDIQHFVERHFVYCAILSKRLFVEVSFCRMSTSSKQVFVEYFRRNILFSPGHHIVSAYFVTMYHVIVRLRTRG